MTAPAPRVALIAITKHGVRQMTALAEQMPSATIVTSKKFSDAVEPLSNPTLVYQGAMRAEMERLFDSFDQLVFFVSLGAVVRLIAPHLQSKDEDPGVIIVDDAGEFVIPVLSGHVGGANEYAERVAGLLQATPVVTTASDVGKTIPVDILGRELGWKIEAPKINVTRVSADVVNEEPIAFVQEAGSPDWWARKTPLPANIHLYDRFEQVDLEKERSILWVTHRELDPSVWAQLEERLVVYRPPHEQKLFVGMGCDRNTPLETLEVALEQALQQLGRSRSEIVALATIDKKGDEEALLELSEREGWPLHFFSARELAQVEVPNPSEVVMKYMGTPAVAEAAAILAAESTMDALLIEKHKVRGKDGKNATVSIIEKKSG